jgi:autotransporter-associated beta strand protein
MAKCSPWSAFASRILCGWMALVCVAVASAPGSAIAQTWQGSNGVWSNAANWLPAAPVSGTASALVFTGGTAENDLGTTFDAGRITFSSGVTSLTGNAIRLATASGTSILNLTTAGTQTIGFGIDLGGTSAAHTRIFSGTSTASGTSRTVFSGNLTGIGGVSFQRSGTAGIPVFVLSGTNSYTGNTTVGASTVSGEAARLILASPDALPTSGTVRLISNNGGTVLELSNWTSGTISNNFYFANGGNAATIQMPFGTSLTLSGTIDMYRGGISNPVGTTLYLNSLAANTDDANGRGPFRADMVGTMIVYGAAQPSFDIKVPLNLGGSGGTFILANPLGLGTNTTGTFGFSASTLQVALASHTFANPVTLANNASTTLSGTGDITFSGRIMNGSHTGSRFLIKQGPMTLTLSNSNSFLSGLSVQEGVAVLDHAFALPGGIGATSASGTVTAALRLTGGVVGIKTGSFARTLGTGSDQALLQTGGFAGYAANQVVNLGGASGVATWGAGGFNGVATGTFMATPSGTFVLGSANATHAIDFQNPINFSGTVRNIQADGPGGILSGVLSNGGLRKSGAGTLSLAADNLYTGTTTVVGGTLQVGVGGVAGSLAAGSPVSVSSTATLAFNRSDSLVYGGTVSGAGGLEQRGGGTLSLTGSHSYSGATVVAAGTLAVGNGGTSGWISAGSPVSIAANAALAFNRSDALVYGGTFSGAGSLVKQGGGALTLGGSNDYAGGTTITAGSIVAQSATALGTGTVTLGAGAAVRLETGAIIANTILGSGTTAGTGAIQFAGGGLERTSTEALATVAELVAGTGAAAVTLDPDFAWSARIAGTTYSDVLDLTRTAGTIQVLQLTYDPSLLVEGQLETDAFLGWLNGGTWVNSVVGNSTTGGSALGNQLGSWASLGITPTAAFLGSWGRDTTAKTVWAVVDHNSEYAAIIPAAVPEPGSLALAALGIGLAGWAAARRRRR